MDTCIDSKYKVIMRGRYSNLGHDISQCVSQNSSCSLSISLFLYIHYRTSYTKGHSVPQILALNQVSLPLRLSVSAYNPIIFTLMFQKSYHSPNSGFNVSPNGAILYCEFRFQSIANSSPDERKRVRFMLTQLIQ